MNDIEERLARLRPRQAPVEIFDRARSGLAPRRAHPSTPLGASWKEIPMVIAAGALMAVLVTVLWPAPPLQDRPAAAQEDWLDREAGARDLAPETARRFEALVAQLGDDAQETRDKAHLELERSIDAAIAVVRAAKDSTDAEIRARVAKLVEAYGKRPKLAPAVARARKEGKPEADWVKLVQQQMPASPDWSNVVDRALQGDGAFAGVLREVGWHCAPKVADAAAKGPADRQIAARALLRDLCKPLFETRTKVVLDRRADNDAYGTAAYSFLFKSQDLAAHGNYVDLVFNGCGTLHFNPYGGAKNRVADLGRVEMADVKAVPEKGWRDDCIAPREGHVYVFEGTLATSVAIRKYEVKFVVTEATADTVTVEWAPLGEMPKPPRAGGMGRAGTMGQCGGRHPEK